MMKLLSKVESWLVHSAQKVLLLMMMMIFPNFADAKSNSEATGYRLPYTVVRAIEEICGDDYDDVYGDYCDVALIREVVITDDGIVDYEIAFAGHLICGSAGCLVNLVFSEDGNYKTVNFGMHVPVFSIEWQESDGTSSPVDFLTSEGLRHEGCRPRWKWTGSTYAIAHRCPTD